MQTLLRTFVLAFTAAAVLSHGVRAGDRQDSPDLENSYFSGQLDLADLYVFRSPTNANNTVLILLTAPHAQVVSASYFDPKARYEFKIDSTEDFKPDLTFRFQFGPPNALAVQTFKLQRMAGRQPFKTIAEGSTATNIPLPDGGVVRTGIFDDPFFFDTVAFNGFIDDGTGPIPRAGAKNFYGPNANILGMVIEIPSTQLVKEGQTANNTILAVWGRVIKGGIQKDRVGRPLTNLLLVPRAPRNQATKDMRTLFNRGQPASDKRRFGPAAAQILQNLFGRTESDANAIANLFLPDVLLFQIGNPNGYGTFISSLVPDSPFSTVFGNGRRLRDDTVDTFFNIFSNGVITSDNVPDDNTNRITDGNAGTTAAFPYLGFPNFFVTGPNP